MNSSILLYVLSLSLLALFFLCVWLLSRLRLQRSALALASDSQMKLLQQEGMRREEVNKYRFFLESCASKVIRYNQNCQRVYVSAGADKAHDGYTETLLGKTPSELPGGETGHLFEQSIRQVFTTKLKSSYDMHWESDQGKRHVTHFELLPELDNKGEVITVLGVGRDISDEVASKQRIEQMVSFDQLTQLPNRLYLCKRVSELIAKQVGGSVNKMPSPGFALMQLDIDAFKELNDLLGFAQADQLLCAIAQRLNLLLIKAAKLQSSELDEDHPPLLARLGGDEFAILLPFKPNRLQSGASKSTPHRKYVSKLAGKVIKAFSKPFKIGGREVFATCSLGVAIFPEDAVNAEQLLMFGDSAMYHAKKLGRNNFQFYQTEFTRQSIERTELENDLHKAIQHAELELHYQPQVMQRSGIIIGAEALLRWRHSSLGMIPPDKFIPIAEETGLIIEIGHWVLQQAFQTAVAWNKPQQHATEQAHCALPSCKIAINLSSRQFVRNDLVADIKQLLKETQCQPQWVELEITESLLLDENGDVLRMLMELSDLGFALSIDDFGTGYSALSYLNRYPISQIKIDRSFICDIPMDLEKCELVKVIIQIAKVLHLDLVAEGIETSEQMEYLVRFGCDVAQGYFYYRPMGFAELDQIIRADKRAVGQDKLLAPPVLSVVS